LGDVVSSVSHVSNSDLSSENTLSILSGVGIGNIRFDTSSMFNIFEGVRRKTSFASVVIKITSAINKLLFREGNVLSLSEDVPVGFQRSDGGESPARSTPGVFSHIVVTNFNEGLSEDLESEFRLGGVGTLILSVDLASDCLSEDTFTIDEVTVFDIEVDVGQGQS
jgi:hypothetical protein